MTDRHQRQTLLPQVGRDGQARLAAARVTIVGVGALGASVADQFARAGVGAIALVDRDVVELTNLQRQTLYTLDDVERGLPKVEAAAHRLQQIDPTITLTPIVVDVDARTLPTLPAADLIVDGSDNADLRYLLNDFAVSRGVPWAMAGVIGVEGRACGFAPNRDGRPCLRCLFETPPSAGELATCDTAGVLGPAVGAIASLQATEALKLLLSHPSAASTLHVVDIWRPRFATIDVSAARRPDCPCCGQRRFEFLDRPTTAGARLCGRNAVQVRPPSAGRIDLAQLAARLAPIAEVETTTLMVRITLPDRPDVKLSVFGDGRMLVVGTEDVAAARGLYARTVGS